MNNYQVLLYNSLGLYINTLILDRFGRIRILAIGVIGCACSIIIEAAMVARYAGTNNKVGNVLRRLHGRFDLRLLL